MKESKIFSERNLTEIVHYVYRVTIDGKYYIGKRSGLLNDLHTRRYKTSSKLVHEKLRNGVTFSKIKIIQVFSTEKEALEFEKRILMRVNASKNPKFLNQCNGGNGNYTCKGHTEKSKKKMRERFNPETEEGRKRRENQSQSTQAQFDINTEEGRKRRENLSKTKKALYDINTEEGRKQRENHSKKMKEYYNPDTEEGRKNREINSEKGKAQFDPNTEEGRKQRKINSKSKKEYYKTERGIKRREYMSEKGKERFNPETEEGRKRREYMYEKGIERFNPETEEGRKRREYMSNKRKEYFNPDTEEGRKQREIQSEKVKSQFDPNTEAGRKRRENYSKKMKEKAKERIQNRKNASILGELIFDEAFIKENFLIIDNKNNQRFLWSVYSKLSGYSESHIIALKREGQLSFLHRIRSISISEELENSKIKEIEAIIKSRNEELSLKAS